MWSLFNRNERDLLWFCCPFEIIDSNYNFIFLTHKNKPQNHCLPFLYLVFPISFHFNGATPYFFPSDTLRTMYISKQNPRLGLQPREKREKNKIPERLLHLISSLCLSGYLCHSYIRVKRKQERRVQTFECGCVFRRRGQLSFRCAPEGKSMA